MSQDLSSKPHVEAATKKANNSLAFLRRNLSSCPAQTKETAYKSLVRPTLEYASTVWDPHTQECINQLEAVQRRAARFVKGGYHTTSSTSQMLAELGWSSLQHRRQQAKLLMMYRIVHGLIEIHLPQNLHYASTTTRGHSSRFIVPYCRTDSLTYSFFPSAVRLWNVIPEHQASAPSLEAFKERLTRN